MSNSILYDNNSPKNIFNWLNQKYKNKDKIKNTINKLNNQNIQKITKSEINDISHKVIHNRQVVEYEKSRLFLIFDKIKFQNHKEIKTINKGKIVCNNILKKNQIESDKEDCQFKLKKVRQSTKRFNKKYQTKEKALK